VAEFHIESLRQKTKCNPSSPASAKFEAFLCSINLKKTASKQHRFVPFSCIIYKKERNLEMTLCPIAVVASCKQCPVFKVCPLKNVLGDHKPDNTIKKANGSKEKKQKS
jgi:hypothetical protein